MKTTTKNKNNKVINEKETQTANVNSYQNIIIKVIQATKEIPDKIS